MLIITLFVRKVALPPNALRVFVMIGCKKADAHVQIVRMIILDHQQLSVVVSHLASLVKIQIVLLVGVVNLVIRIDQDVVSLVDQIALDALVVEVLNDPAHILAVQAAEEVLVKRNNIDRRVKTDDLLATVVLEAEELPTRLVHTPIALVNRRQRILDVARTT